MEIVVRSPETEKEWEAYYLLRWEVLRKPWQQPEGSEKDTLESDAIHAAAFIDNELIGVGRLNIEEGVGKIRFMATAPKAERKGVAKMIVQYLEHKAKEKRVSTIQLNAREVALPFYEKQGYQLVQKGHLLYGDIQHYVMEKVMD